ncbi:MAG: HD domain-containing protein [Allorhizobium sp.]
MNNDDRAAAFAPYEELAARLIDEAASGDDGAHDIAHILRVFRNAMRMRAEEGGDGRILTAAVLLHDSVSVEKNSPLRAKASRMAADKASTLLAALGWQRAEIDAVAHAIEAHSFTANIAPLSLEAKILQDADRLDAIGMIGAARCFYIAGRLGSGLYDPFDPLAQRRPLDDKTYAIDHFQTKLFKLADGFQTATGRRLAQVRHDRLIQVRDLLIDEI